MMKLYEIVIISYLYNFLPKCQQTKMRSVLTGKMEAFVNDIMTSISFSICLAFKIHPGEPFNTQMLEGSTNDISPWW